MESTPAKWSVLLTRFFKETITRPERAELDRQRTASPMKDDQFRRLTNLQWIISVLKDMDDFDKERSWNRVLTHSVNLPGAIVLRTPWRRKQWAMAASLTGLLIIGVTVYILSSKRSGAPVADIVSMKNTATLIWNDKQVIKLDEKKDGILIKTPEMEVSKENGIIYLKGNPYGITSSSKWNKLNLPRGSNYKLSLQDGTLVSMNASSSIQFPTQFSKDERKVIIQGEGFLDIAKNPKVPFIVELGNYQVEALGTKFIVHAFKGEKNWSVALISGKVNISSAKRVLATLQAGEQFHRVNGKDTVVPNHYAEEKVEDWENGRFSLNQPLSSVLDDVSKWYGVQVQYAAQANNPPLYGYYARNQPLSKVLEYLDSLTGMNIKFTNEQIIKVSNKK